MLENLRGMWYCLFPSHGYSLRSYRELVAGGGVYVDMCVSVCVSVLVCVAVYEESGVNT